MIISEQYFKDGFVCLDDYCVFVIVFTTDSRAVLKLYSKIITREWYVVVLSNDSPFDLS